MTADPPAGSSIHAWYAPALEVLAAEGATWSTDDDRAHVDRSGPARHERLAARGLLRRALAWRHGRAAEAWRIERLPGGQPALRGSGPLPHVSLAHADGFVACAFAAVPVGVDVESAARAATLADADESWLAPDEALARPELGDASLADWLGRRFTAKEAVAKALGRGFALDPRRIAIADEPVDAPVSFFARVLGEDTPSLLGWRERILEPSGAFHLAVAAVTPPTSVVARIADGRALLPVA